MNVMQFTLQYQTPVSADALIVPVTKSTQMDPVLSQISEKTGIPADHIKTDFKAALKDVHTLYFTENKQNKRIFLLGLGEKPRSIDIINAFRSFVFKRKSSLPGSLAVSFLHDNVPEDPAAWIEAAVNGMLLGSYDIGLYKTEKQNGDAPKNNDAKITVCVAEQHAEAAEAALEKGKATAATQLEIFTLVNAPANKKTPETLAEWAVQSGKKYGYQVQVFDKKEIEKLGFHAVLAVNRGSETPPTFIVMEYKPEGKKTLKKIGLVGKGVTFDTGGLSIKPSANMHYMKTDMGGAAAVLGTMELAAKLQLPFHLVGIVPATENSVDANSIRPGDVIGSYNGKTIEVIDTDAEGRLILADGLSYIVRNFQPDILIDLATLTGSCIRTLGMYAGGLFSNNDGLAAQLLKACEKTGERLWQLPLWDDYKNELKSDVADIKNFSGNPSAGAITAAKFLEAFIENHTAWAHMDIAGVAVGDSEFSSQKSATGFGIRLLVEYMESLAAQKPA
jgi:leucyl aminopeptidase